MGTAEPEKMLIQILNRATKDNCFELALERGMQQYQLKTYNIAKLTPPKILSIYKLIAHKFYSSDAHAQFEFWYENELRIFLWILVIYCHLENKKIENLTQAHWRLFSFIFHGKNPDTFEFQSLCLIKRRKTKKWAAEEIKMLVSIIKEKQQKNRWNEIAKTIFVLSRKKYFRTPKQCREQWINHLDPSKSKEGWTLLEDYQMINNVLENGKKWSKVAREIGNHRTEHMVKNRYNSLIKQEIKRLNFEEIEELVAIKIKQRLESNNALKKILLNKKNHEFSCEVEKQVQINVNSSEIEKQDTDHIEAKLFHQIQNEQNSINPKQQCSATKCKEHKAEQSHCQMSAQIEEGEGQEEGWIWNDDPQIEDLHLQQFFIEQEGKNSFENEIDIFFKASTQADLNKFQ